MCVKVTQYDCEILPQLNGFVDRYFEDSDPKAEHSAEGEGAGGERGTGGGGGTVGAGGVEATRQMNSPLMLVEAFLRALTNTDKDGRIVITRAGTWTLRELNMSKTYIPDIFLLPLLPFLLPYNNAGERNAISFLSFPGSVTRLSLSRTEVIFFCYGQ